MSNSTDKTKHPSSGEGSNTALCSTEIIPFHESPPWSLATDETYKGEQCKLSEGRSVGVGVNSEGHCNIQIDRTNEEGKIVRLAFGLSNEAAKALCLLLSKQVF
jgi:hypothetical protein